MTIPRKAFRIELRFEVRRVGFRPAVYRLAHELSLVGWVHNDGQGLTIHAEGAPAQFASFVAALPAWVPPVSRIVSFRACSVPVEGFGAFEIRASLRSGSSVALTSPDLSVCDE